MAHRPTEAQQYTDEDGRPVYLCEDCGAEYPSAAAAQTCCQD